MTGIPTSALFRHVEELQGEAAWGSFLDAGTGVSSALWSLGLATERWTGVTGAAGHARQVRQAAGGRLRAQDELIVGNWMDPALLRDQVFDTVLADYLIGAVEGFAPYFQSRMFPRLASHVGRVLYVVGLDPYIVGEAADEAARVVRAVGRMRDACQLLADETPYREYPMEWVAQAVSAAGFSVMSARRFPNRYREKWVNSQLDMALRRLPKIADPGAAAGLQASIESLREHGLRVCRQEGGLRYGADYVLACVRRS